MEPSVIHIGDGPTALSALRSLCAGCDVRALVRAGPALCSDPVRAFAAERGVPVHASAGFDELCALVEAHAPEAVVISSFNRILPTRLLRLSTFVNVHYSPLPRYRGRANVNWALINGEPTAAISIHRVNEGLDDGGVLYQQEIPIGPEDTATSLYDRLNAIQERELAAAVRRALAGDPGRIQDPREASYGCARLPDDGEVDWAQGAQAIDRLIRALAPPFPGAFTHLEGRLLRLVRATPQTDAPRYEGRVPGRVIGLSRRQGWVDVLTGEGVLRLHEVADEDGATRPAAAVVTSTRMTLGLSRLDLLRRIETLEARLRALETAARARPPVAAEAAS